MRSYDAYLFDLYGTLIDIHTDESSMSFWKKAREIFYLHGAEYEAKELKDRYFSIIAELERKQAQKGHLIEIDIAEVFRELFLQKGNILDDPAGIAWQFRQASTSHLRLYVGAEELLKTLHAAGKQVYLLSNAQSLFTMPELKLLKIADLFDDIIISSDVGYRKPDPEIFRYLLDKHGLSAAGCLMIGNDLKTDVSGAKAMGIDSYYIHSKLSSSHQGSGIIPTYSQEGMNLPRLLQKLRS